MLTDVDERCLNTDAYTYAYEGGWNSPHPLSLLVRKPASLRVNTRTCAYGGANSPAPYLHPVQRQLSYVGGGG